MQNTSLRLKSRRWKSLYLEQGFLHASGVQPSGSWGILVLNSLALNPGCLPDPAILLNKEKIQPKKEVLTRY